MKELKKYYCFKFWLYEDRGICSVDANEYEDDEPPVCRKHLIFNTKIFYSVINKIKKTIDLLLKN